MPIVLLVAACASGQNEADEAANSSGAIGGESNGADVEFGSLDELITAAKEEGTLTLYSGANADTNQAWLDGFYEEYGIGGAFFRAPGGPLIQRFSAEQDAGGSRADVMVNSPPTFFEDNPDWFVDIDGTSVLNLDDYPADWVADEYVVVANMPVVVTYNTEAVAENAAPSSWTDVVDSRYRGQIILTDPRQSDQYLAVLKQVMQEHGVEYLEALGNQDLRLTGSSVSGAQEVASGAYQVSVPGFPGTTLPTMAQGAPVKWAALQDPLLAGELDAAIPVDAPNPAAARLFVYWLLSESGASATCSLDSYSVPSDPAGERGCIPFDSLQRLDFVTSDEDRARILGALQIE